MQAQGPRQLWGSTQRDKPAALLCSWHRVPEQPPWAMLSRTQGLSGAPRSENVKAREARERRPGAFLVARGFSVLRDVSLSGSFCCPSAYSPALGFSRFSARALGGPGAWVGTRVCLPVPHPLRAFWSKRCCGACRCVLVAADTGPRCLAPQLPGCGVPGAPAPRSALWLCCRRRQVRVTFALAFRLTASSIRAGL